MTDNRHIRARDIGASVAAGHSTGEFTTHKRPDGDTVLSLTGNEWDSTATAEPSLDQVNRARAAAERHLAFNKNASAADLEQLTRQKAVVIAEQEGAYTAWKAGVEHPDDPHFADIWDGLAPGVSRTDAEQKLAKALAKRADQDTNAAGTTLGYRNSPLAQQHLNDSIALYEEALRCDGRNLSVNQGNVRMNKRDADKIPF